MKEAPRERRFSSDEVIGAVQNLSKKQPNTFLLMELKELVKR
jgi:hypothetical protein